MEPWLHAPRYLVSLIDTSPVAHRLYPWKGWDHRDTPTAKTVGFSPKRATCGVSARTIRLAPEYVKETVSRHLLNTGNPRRTQSTIDAPR